MFEYGSFRCGVHAQRALLSLTGTAIALLGFGATPAAAFDASVEGTTLVVRPDAGSAMSFYAEAESGPDFTGGTADDLGIRVTSNISGPDDDPVAGAGCVPNEFGNNPVCSAGGGPWGGITDIDMIGSEEDDVVLVTDIDPPLSASMLGGDDDVGVFDGSAGTNVLDGGAGDDVLRGGTDALNEITGGDDNDTLTGDNLSDIIDGGPDQDRIIGWYGDDDLKGGEGNDELYGDDLTQLDDEGHGVDTVDGEGGNDLLDGGFNADVLVGGTGTDGVTYEDRNPDTTGVGLSVTLDNVANDGATENGTAVENDSVGPDGSIENVTGPYDAEGADVILVGNNEPNVFDSKAFNGTMLLDGAGGNDELITFYGDREENVTLGGPGEDTIDIAGYADGEADDDTIDGSAGDDVLHGGTGVDSLTANDGNDTLYTEADGTPLDRANCGIGADIAVINTGDITDELCEALSIDDPEPGDTTPPVTTINQGPAEGATIQDNTPTFGFTATDARPTRTDRRGGIVTFECKVDTGAFAICTSPTQIGPLADGAHSFSVRATDDAGNTESPKTRNFTVDTSTPGDTTPPETTITTGPAEGSTTNDATPEFGFTSNEAGSTFECKLDGGNFSACTSPFTAPTLAAGSHTFQVRATDAAGNVDASPATRNFTVDTGGGNQPPVLNSIGNKNATVGSQLSFQVSATDADADALTYSASNLPAGANFDAGSRTFTWTPAAAGTFNNVHFEVSDGTDSDSEDITITVTGGGDTTPPETTIESAPKDVIKVKKGKKATAKYVVTANEPGATIEGRINGGVWQGPLAQGGIKIPDLGKGNYTIEFRATDAAGNVDQSPASDSFKVKRKKKKK